MDTKSSAIGAANWTMGVAVLALAGLTNGGCNQCDHRTYHDHCEGDSVVYCDEHDQVSSGWCSDGCVEDFGAHCRMVWCEDGKPACSGDYTTYLTCVEGNYESEVCDPGETCYFSPYDANAGGCVLSPPEECEPDQPEYCSSDSKSVLGCLDIGYAAILEVCATGTSCVEDTTSSGAYAACE